MKRKRKNKKLCSVTGSQCYFAEKGKCINDEIQKECSDKKMINTLQERTIAVEELGTNYAQALVEYTKARKKIEDMLKNDKDIKFTTEKFQKACQTLRENVKLL